MTFVQNINQNTTIQSVVTTHNAGGTFTNVVNHNWPLTLDLTEVYNPSNGIITLTTISNQYYEKDQEGKHNGQATSFSLLQNRVTTTDAADINNSTGEIIGNQDQSSAQRYFASDSTGYCYSRDITAAANVLTSVTNGQGCN